MGKKKSIGGHRIDVRDLFGFPGNASRQTDSSEEIEPKDSLNGLLLQLRDFGVRGSDSDLEELLGEARFDLQQALNIYLDRGSTCKRRKDSEGHEECDTDGQLSTGRGSRKGRGKGRGARPRAATEPATDGGLKAPSSRPRALTEDIAGGSEPSVRQTHSVSQCREVRVLPIGHDGAPCGVHFLAADGKAVEVDLRSMRQTDPETGISQEVRRIKPRVWRVQSGPRKWTQYPNEVCRELEWLHLAVEPKERPSQLEQVPAKTQREPSFTSALQRGVLHEASFKPGEMASDKVSEMKELCFQSIAQDPCLAAQAAKLLGQLVKRQGLVCTTSDARRAGLVLGSMILLKAVMLSNSNMAVIGAEIFDQRYPSLKLNVEGRKNGIRSLLARGMTLGSHAPTSKLLRKIEADSRPHWEERYLAAMMQACPLIPERTGDHVRMFLSRHDEYF